MLIYEYKFQVNTANSIGDWEKFDESFDFKNGSIKWSYKTAHGKYLSAEEGDDALIKGDRDSINDWEKFKLA